MENKKLKWCFKLKDGLRIKEPNELFSESYLEQAKVATYYAEYYSIYSFLQKIGIKCKNYFCSILAVSFLLGKEKTKIINEHKEKRIDAQYYMKIGEENKVRKMLQEAKIFVSMFDEIVSNLTKEEIILYRKKILEVK